jgi:hypothetical protein
MTKVNEGSKKETKGPAYFGDIPLVDETNPSA